jgi:acetyl-CoA C-acetyltransferase
MDTDSIVVVGAARTPMGGFQGELKDAAAPQLGATAIGGALRHTGLSPEHVDEVLMGCVLSAGQGQAPARQASLAAGIPKATGCTTVNKMCGSGMKTAMLAYDSVVAGSNRVVVAGGMESMSNAPYLLGKARAGLRMGHAQMQDHMFVDGLEDAYDKGRLMGSYAEDCAQHYQFTRDAQDEFAVESLTRAQRAIDSGAFTAEVTPVTITTRRSEQRVEHDEQPHKAKFDKIPKLKPAFRESGTVTAANSSSISDGAAALVLMRESDAERRGATPIARILGHASYADAPGWFTTAPIHAIRQLLDKLNWQTSDVDLYEINEAFAVVTMAAMRDLNLPHDNVNVHGGACALGHPIGASGARIIVTLLNALRQQQAKRGVAALCIGGGEATAMGFELIS